MNDVVDVLENLTKQIASNQDKKRILKNDK